MFPGMVIGPNPMTGTLIRQEKFRQRHMEGRQPLEDRSRDWSDAATNQGSEDFQHPSEATRDKEEPFLGGFREIIVLVAPYFQTFSFHIVREKVSAVLNPPPQIKSKDALRPSLNAPYLLHSRSPDPPAITNCFLLTYSAHSEFSMSYCQWSSMSIPLVDRIPFSLLLRSQSLDCWSQIRSSPKKRKREFVPHTTFKGQGQW